jgi:hypothetical protein
MELSARLKNVNEIEISSIFGVLFGFRRSDFRSSDHFPKYLKKQIAQLYDASISQLLSLTQKMHFQIEDFSSSAKRLL